MKKRIKIVLVNPSHPGNIGATARAMKTMGLARLTLVAPRQFPDVNATARAAGADDILAQAEVCDSLASAIHGCQIVIGTSARLRVQQLPILTPRAAGEFIVTQPCNYNIAILFGRESSGLTNAELATCSHQIHIATDPDFSSLNLASAVQLICYEIRTAALANHHEINSYHTESPLATAAARESFYQHLATTLTQLEFCHHHNDRQIMGKLQRLFNRTQLEVNELQILRGILTAINQLKKRS